MTPSWDSNDYEKSRYMNELNLKASDDFKSSYNCPVASTGLYFANTIRYQNLAQDLPNLNWKVTTIEKDNGIDKIMEKDAAYYPKNEIQNEREKMNVKFWIASPVTWEKGS